MNDKWIDKFKKCVVPIIIEEFKPERIILFGSRINGVAHEYSDIDVIVVSNFFVDIPFIKRMPLVLKKTRFDKHIDFICYSTEEFNRTKTRSSVLINALERCEIVNI